VRDHRAAHFARHVRAHRRSVLREEAGSVGLPEESALALASRLVSSASSPSQRLLRKELRQRVQAALLRLPARDREVLVLRHLEQLSVAEESSP